MLTSNWSSTVWVGAFGVALWSFAFKYLAISLKVKSNKQRNNEWVKMQGKCKSFYFCLLFMNTCMPIGYAIAPLTPNLAWMICLGICYLLDIFSMIVLANSIVRIRNLMGTNLQVVQYDDKAMIYHVISLSLLMITMLFLLISLSVFGSVNFSTGFGKKFLIMSFFCEFTYFVSMVLLAKIFNTIVNRANMVNEGFEAAYITSPKVSLNSPRVECG